ncbi:MAG TPA: response regulator [Thermodesulfobacteriota bacterium]|nr:response regulator [Thermodesulfobacteriota bacterium]
MTGNIENEQSEIKIKPPVLVVDDDKNQLKVISGILSMEDLQPLCFTNAADAIELCAKQSINVAIIDLSLPDCDGLDLLKQLKEINPDMKVIINTGYASLETAMEAVNKEAFAYITKMGNVEELLSHVHRAFHDHLTRYNEQLAREVSSRTAELQRSNMELKYEITERRKMQEELIKARQLESLGILAGGIAHDFNNLLTAILGNISLSKLYSDKENEVYKRLEEAEKASIRARDLTQQLLTFAKGGSPVKKPTDIKDLIVDSVTLALRGSKVKSEYEFDADIYSIEADAGQIAQVVNNITINSKQSMPDGGVIRVNIKNINNPGKELVGLTKSSYICISIADEGIGIPEAYISKIFDPYFTTKQDGHGLGLATSYSIVKKHEGLITVESETGKGTNFKIYLPAQPDDADKVSKNYDSEETVLNGKGRILIMDDENGIREIVSAMLSRIGYSVVCTKDNDEAIAEYKKAYDEEKSYDAVILDLTIPGGQGGHKTLEDLLKIDPDVKAIVSSGYYNDPVMSEFRKYGFLGCVAKPFKTSELSEILSKVIKQ